MIAENLSIGWDEVRSLQKKRRGQRRYSGYGHCNVLEGEVFIWIKAASNGRFYQLDLYDVRDETHLSRLQHVKKTGKKICLDSLLGVNDPELDCVCIDSSRIQTFSGNEWLENKHGKQYSRRIWKKLHIVTTGDGQIIANSMTEHNKDDRSQIQPLLMGILA